MVLIAPSILSADFGNIAKEIERVEKAGADWLHLDVMDGHFVPNLTFGPLLVEAVHRCTDLPLDVHLMIQNPAKYIQDFARAGADFITFHIEDCRNPLKVISLIRKHNVKAGCSIKPRTGFESIKPIVKELNLVLIMTVEPGFGGQKFMPQMLSKIRKAKDYIIKNRLKTLIEVDGGINPSTSRLVREAGADVLVAGASIFKSSDYNRVIRALHNS